jgi:hypothetical protein
MWSARCVGETDTEAFSRYAVVSGRASPVSEVVPRAAIAKDYRSVDAARNGLNRFRFSTGEIARIRRAPNFQTESPSPRVKSGALDFS